MCEAMKRSPSEDLLEALNAKILKLFSERGREVLVDPGEMIFREGDPEDVIYIVTGGSVQLLGRAFDGSDVAFARLGPGHMFGEHAISPAGPSQRSESARAVTRCRLLALVRDAVLAADAPLVRMLREVGEAQRRARRRKFREDVLQRFGLASRYRIERFSAGRVVYHQGAPAREVHLVLAGVAQVVRREGNVEEVIAELLPGLLFGEQAVVHNERHASSIVAATELETASIDAAWFRMACGHSPQLRALLEALATMYRLPRRGRLRLQGGALGGPPTLIARQDLPDGRRVASTCVVGHAAFSARVIDAPEATMVHRFEDVHHERLREVHLVDGRIVEVESEGDWDQLPEVVTLLLDGVAVDQDRFASLAATGALGGTPEPPEKGDYVCHCARVTLVQIKRALRSGCQTLEQLAQATRVTRDCGECSPAIKELLGDSDWVPARCHHIIPVTEDVRTFQIRPLHGECLPWLPGQHIVVQAEIDGRWIARPYTLSGTMGDRCGYEITVKREPDGTMTPWLFDHLRGDSELRISAPAGSFTLAEHQTRDVVCLVGGIGITPALAMARSLAAVPRDFRLFIDYSVSRTAQAIYREELLDFYRSNPKIRVNLRITERDGRLDGAKVRLLVSKYPYASFYLCGRRAYMEAMERNLVAAGVAPDRVASLHFRSEAEWYAGSSGSWNKLQLEPPPSAGSNRAAALTVVFP
jgi:ferredoxin-NADP reductase/CRP-like cAMP-binding protein